MTRLLSTAEPGALIAAAVILLAGIGIAAESGRRKIQAWSAARAGRAASAARLAEDMRMAARAFTARTTHLHDAETSARQLAQAGEWPTVHDLAAVTNEVHTDTSPAVEVPAPRTHLYVVPQLSEAASA